MRNRVVDDIYMEWRWRLILHNQLALWEKKRKNGERSRKNVETAWVSPRKYKYIQVRLGQKTTYPKPLLLICQ